MDLETVILHHRASVQGQFIS